LALGCEDSKGNLLTVTGTVRFADGSPIVADQGGMILFMPDGGGKTPTGEVQADGAFTMMTEKPGDGVKPGKYKVVLQLWQDYRAGKLAVPAKYGDHTQTPLEVTVDADHTHFDLKVEK
jgi:hypothetical protein